MKREVCLTLVLLVITIERRVAESAPRQLSLQQAVEIALERSPRLEALRAELEGAEADLTTAETYPYNPVFEVELGDRRSPLESTVDARLGLAQEIEIRGQRSERVRSAQAVRDATELQFERERKLLIARVTLAFSAAVESRELLQVQSDDVALAGDLAEVSTRRFRGGAVSAFEANLPLVSLGRAEAEAEAARAVYQAAQASLAETVAVSDEGLVVPQGELLLPRREERLAVPELVASALERREDLLAFRQWALAAAARLELARAEPISRVAVGGFYKKEERTDTILGGSLRVDLPIFDRNAGGIEAARADIRRTRAEAEVRALVVREEVLSAHARFLAAVAAAGHLEARVIGNLEENSRLLRVAYEAGKIGFGEILLFRRELVEARRDYVSAVAEAWRAAVVLDLAAGRVPIQERIQVD